MQSRVGPFNRRAWLFVVTRRLAHRRKIREMLRANGELAFLSTLHEREPDVDLIIDIGSVLAQLRGRDRLLLTRVAQGAVAREIALEFGCQVRDVGQMVARARRKARELMARSSS
jgi:DNA-directed RNA polymerase specialized sigma24 family protein